MLPNFIFQHAVPDPAADWAERAVEICVLNNKRGVREHQHQTSDNSGLLERGHQPELPRRQQLGSYKKEDPSLGAIQELETYFFHSEDKLLRLKQPDLQPACVWHV